jgi:hypothetical protein
MPYCEKTISIVSASTIADSPPLKELTAVRLKVEENQLVGVFGKIGIQVNALKGA